MNWNAVNDRAKREAVLGRIAGGKLDESSRIALETAEGVQEAARFIRQMREHAKLTQDALGKKLGVTQARISELEKGGTPEGVSYSLLRRVAKACGLPDWPAAPLESVVKTVDPASRVTVAVVPQRAEHPPTLRERMAVHAVGGEVWRRMRREHKNTGVAVGQEVHEVTVVVVAPSPQPDSRESPISREDEVELVRTALQNSPGLKVLESR